MTHVGQAIPHESAAGHVTGQAVYADDLCPRYVGMLHAWPIQAPHAHARVRSLDASRALDVAGVARVLTAQDVPGINNVGPAKQDEPLFPDLVQHQAQAVAWVLAETEEAAKTAAQTIVVEYDALPEVLNIEQAIEANQFLTKPARIRRGDPDTALAQAAHHCEGELRIGGQEHFYLETQAAVAHRDEAGHVMVHSSTQHPTETQAIVARVLGVHSHDVICQSLRMGGAFGGKEVQANAYAAIAALGAQLTGHPVRVRLDRRRDFELTGKRHPFLARYRAGFGSEGRLQGVYVRLYSDGGYSLDLSRPIMQRALFHIDNCYRLDDVEVVGVAARTHKTSQTAFRGFGGPQAMVVIEEVIDRVARHLSVPPHVVRERNFYREGDTTHYGQKVGQADRITRIWRELRRDASFEERWADVERFNAAHRHCKRGIAITPVKFGIAFTTAFFNQAGALVLLYQDGSVQVNHGGTEMGQGLHTKMLQVAAQALGVDREAIRMMPTRTDKVPNTSATAASSGSDLNGAAVRQACLAIKRRLADVAATEFGVAPADVEFDGGDVFPRGARNKAKPFGALARQAYLQRVPLFATGYYGTPDLHYDDETGRGHPFHYFAYGSAVVEVEVDGFTGQYAFRRVDILHDVGDSISPLVDGGQVEGGFVQGVGWLTREELHWNAEGRLTTNGASTYKLPSLDDCPEQFNVRLLDRATEPGVIHGSKAVGEPPLMLAIAAREALRQAVAAFRPNPDSATADGIQLGCPSTPEAVFFAIESARRAT